MRYPYAMPGKKTFLTVKEAADLLQVSSRTMYDMARDGRLGEAALKVGGAWRIDEGRMLGNLIYHPPARESPAPRRGNGSLQIR